MPEDSAFRNGAGMWAVAHFDQHSTTKVTKAHEGKPHTRAFVQHRALGGSGFSGIARERERETRPLAAHCNPPPFVVKNTVMPTQASGSSNPRKSGAPC